MKSIPVGTKIRKGNLTGVVVSKRARASGVQEIRFDDIDHFLGGVEWWSLEMIRAHVQYKREGEKVTP